MHQRVFSASRAAPGSIQGRHARTSKTSSAPAATSRKSLAPFFMGQRELQLRIRAICFAFLTPFYFLKAGSLIEWHALVAGIALSVFATLVQALLHEWRHGAPSRRDERESEHA